MAKSHSTQSVEERFWSKVEKRGPNECWPWNGTLNPRGRARFHVSMQEGDINAARYLWTVIHGTIPDGLLVCHSCDNPRCVNPAHLWLGTHTDNIRDAASKGLMPAQRWPERMHQIPNDLKARGERVGGAKLTAEKVREIRQQLAAGVSRRDLGLRYGVCCSTIDYISLGRTWAHIE